MAFERHDARKSYRSARGVATINGRPAWRVLKAREDMIAAVRRGDFDHQVEA